MGYSFVIKSYMISMLLTCFFDSNMLDLKTRQIKMNKTIFMIATFHLLIIVIWFDCWCCSQKRWNMWEYCHLLLPCANIFNLIGVGLFFYNIMPCVRFSCCSAYIIIFMLIKARYEFLESKVTLIQKWLDNSQIKIY